MPPFRFRLETLVRLRLVERDQRRAELAKAQQAEAVLVGQIDEIERQRGELTGQLRQLASPGQANIDALVRAHRYELTLITQVKQLAGQLVQVRAEVDRRRQALVEADRGVRVLEKLRERQQTAHQAHQAKLEMRQFDELALLGFARGEVQP